MLIKFETKSNRVKGLSFHPKRPWILASLHSGLIQLWDYRMGTLLDQFDEHEGPVRSVDFHRSQPLFVSGGDDYKIKVWNYKLRRCIFTLQGHLDYIRTVEFHLEQPWIVSSSDDQTIRIWNWQSRTCIAVLTGHNHYVMCASFHPTDDLVVSASLDQTIRVWDISGLKKKNVSSDDFNMKLNQLNQDLFGTNDVMVKYILEGHERGVNWAVFHPTQQLVVSGADDRYVKMWRISDTKAWEIESLTGHGNNVSCVRFHGKKDLVVSNSEDKSIRVWRLSTGQFLTSYKRENDRFWIVSVHPSQNLIAAGHDSGLMIFKLERERPPFTVVKDNLYYIREKYLRKYNLANNSDTPVASIRRTSTNSILNLSYNQQENCILLTSGSGENAAWELFKIPKNTTNDVEVCTQLTKGKGLAAVFTGINKYTYLSNDRSKLIVQNIQTEQTKEITLPVAPVDNIFQAGSGRVLLRSEDKIHLFDFEQQTIIASTAAASVKFAVWSEDMSRVALVSKHILIIANSKLEPLCSTHETIRIKSGAFDDQGVFIYTTLNHLKYCLPNGDSGTIKTLDLPIYIAKVKSNAIHYIDREGVVGILLIDATEYRFKMALLQGKARDIQSIIGQSKILGDSIIAYLQQKGHPNIAMKFVQDDLTKFDLALECGNIDVAFQAAKKLDDKECWQKLGAEALRQGNYLIVEKAYQQTKEFERLSFLYSISGNVPALQKMLKIAGLRQDTMSKFHNALYLGDAEVRVRILLEAGQHSLAYASAVAHGLTELAEEIKKTLDPQFTPQVPENATLLLPPTPIIRETVWPLLNTFEEADETHVIAAAGEADLGEAGWNVEIPGLNENGAAEQPEEEVAPVAPGEGEGWDFLASEELQNISTSIEQTESSDLLFSAPSPGRSLAEYWPENSTHPADHIAAGSFNTALHTLNQTCGIVNFKPLKDYFLSIFMGATTAVPVSSLPAFTIPLQRQSAKNEDDNKHATLPMLTSTSLAELSARAKTGQDALTAAKFEESQKIFRGILHSLLFTILPSRKEEREAKDLIKICVEYIIATRLELIRKSQYKDVPQKNAELAAYFTRCKIHPSHVMLSLASAMAVCCKPEISNFLTAAEFAKRLLKMNPSANLAKQANHVIKMAEQKPSNKFDLNYDERNPFVICSLSLSPIYAGSESIKCSYCQAPFLPKHKGELCPVCEVAEIGLNVPGLQPFKSKGSSMLE